MFIYILNSYTHTQVDMDAIDLENLEKDGDEEDGEDFNPDEDVVIVEEDDFVVRWLVGWLVFLGVSVGLDA
jgi:hypothetical protein